MTVHPGDKPVQRFVAYVVGFAAMFAFALLAPRLLMSSSFISAALFEPWMKSERSGLRRLKRLAKSRMLV